MSKFPQDQPFNVAPLKNKGRVRHGKTAKDKALGCQAQNEANKAARAAWCRGDESVFPVGTCNGKKSRALRGVK